MRTLGIADVSGAYQARVVSGALPMASRTGGSRDLLFVLQRFGWSEGTVFEGRVLGRALSVGGRRSESSRLLACFLD